MAFGVGGGSDNIEIRIQVDNTGAVKILGETEKQIGKVGEASKKASGLVEEFGAGLVKGAVAAGTAYLGFKGIQEVISSINRGSQVDDVAVSFENLSRQAGATADVLLGELQSATANTISNFDLMQKSNELLAAGLNPSHFDEIAKAARSLSEVTGGDLKTSIDTVSQALITGRDKSLALIGVQVDNAKAADDFAKSLGTTADKLSESAVLEANRIAILSALAQKQKELGDVTDDGADLLSQMSTKMSNYSDELDRAIATNPELNKLLTELSKLVQEADFSALINGISGFVSIVSSAIEKLSVFKPLVEATWSVLDYGADRLVEVASGFGKLGELAGDATDAIGLTGGAVDKTTAALFESLDIIDQKTEKQKEEAKTIAALIAYQDKQDEKNKGFISTTKGAGEAAKKAAEELEKLAKQAKELNSIKGIAGLATGLRQIGEDGKKAGATTEQLDKETKELIETYKKLGGTGASALQGINAALEENQRALDENAAKLLELDKKTAEAAKGGASTYLGGLASELSGAAEGDAGLAAAGDSISNSLMSGLQIALSGEKLSKEEIGQEIGGGIGESIGAYFGDPATGRMLGTAVGGALSEAFGKDSAGTVAKKALDEAITDVFKDLQFSGNQNPLEGMFADLPAQAQAAYSAVGDAITAALGQGTDLGVNLGVVLANNNLTLADTQALLQSLGLGFEELSTAMYEAFYSGELSALDLQNRLEEIYGIINGSTAFENLGAAVDAAFTADGRTLLNALKNIGQQAQSTGVTLGSMPDILQSKFGVAADRVQQLMAAMAAAGIKSVADLANAANPVLVALAANISQAQQGVTPDNVAVAAVKTTSSGGGGGGSPKASALRSKASGQTPAQKAAAAAEKERNNILKFWNQAQNSGAGKELEAAIAEGAISDGDYVSKMQTLFENAKDLQKEVDKQEKEFLEVQRTGKGDKAKELKELKAAEKALKDALKGKDKEDKSSLSSQLDSFAQKFAGNIELIQKAAKGLNISFKDLKEQALDAFLAGTKTFAEAKNALNDASGGIDPKKQFDAFKNLGANGGSYSVDALQKIAKASQNSGGTSLDNLSEQLLGGGASQDDVQKLFIALQNSGVNSLDQIANAGSDLVVTIGAQLQDLKFPFAETTSKIRDELKALDDLIQQNRKITIDADVIVSPELRALLGLTGTPLPDKSYGNTSPGISQHSNKKAKKKGFYIDSRTGKQTKEQYSYY